MRSRLVAIVGVLAVVAVVAGLAVVFGRSGHNTSSPAVAPAPTPSPTASHSLPVSPSPRAAKTSRPPQPANPLRGVTVGIDPGHNGGNFADPSYINRPIWNGREHEACNTTGTETDAGYTEARFNFDVASYLRADLKRAGAQVVMTRNSNDGVGPCVNKRAHIINASHAAVAIDIHADGGPASGRGFAVLEPVRDGINDNVVAASRRYGDDIRAAFRRTGMPTSTYDGQDGIKRRDDLAGLNLTTVPQVLLECGNMRNATDAALLTAPRFQRRAARAIMAAMARFLSRP